jgi:hypothetical protein
MAEFYKVLGQNKPTAATVGSLYVVPATKHASSSTLNVCNTGSTDTTFRISIAVAGVVDNLLQYQFYDTPLGANDTLPITVGFTLGPNDVVRCYSTNGNVAFSLFGVEIDL